MSRDQSHLTQYTQQLAMQEIEEAAMRHMWRVMGYGETPGLPNHERHLDRPMATHTEPSVPAITLTEPTPPSSQEASGTSQEITSQAMARTASKKDACSPAAVDRHLQEVYQFSPPTSTNHPQSSNPPLRFAPRPAEDYQAMLQAMETGNFDIPIFGAAGAAFMNRPIAGTPISQNKKRKRAQKPHDTDSQKGESVPKKAAGRKKKAVKLKSPA